jgi:hypothetical protein
MSYIFSKDLGNMTRTFSNSQAIQTNISFLFRRSFYCYILSMKEESGVVIFIQEYSVNKTDPLIIRTTNNVYCTEANKNSALSIY